MARSHALSVIVGASLALAIASGSALAGRTAGLKFHAQSMSWAGSQLGWLLGSEACGQASCTTIVRTSNGGTSWNTIGTMAAPLSYEDNAGVSELRVADAGHGWAFGPALWATSDGGATWQQQALAGGRPVIALAADAQGAYAVASACDFNQDVTTCRHGATLWRTAPGGSWVQVSLRLPVTTEAMVAVHGSTAYVVVATPGSPDGDTFEATTDGVHWADRPDPCDIADGAYLSSVAPISDTQVALLCQGDIGFGYADKQAFRSGDAGATTTPAGTLPLYGIVSQLAASANGTLLASSYSIGSWIYRSSAGETWTTSEDLGDGGIGWNDITFTTNQVAFVIHGPATCCGEHGVGELWKSTDGGLTWRQTQVTP
jgi:hypothetical protein